MGACELKARKGLIRASVTVEGGRISRASITGDFIIIPEDAVFGLEDSLRGAEASRDGVREAVLRALSGASLVGCSIDDFVEVILCAMGESP